MIKCNGLDVVGGLIKCVYNDKPLEGTVLSQKKVEGKGNLLTVKRNDGQVRTIYWEKAVDCTFRPLSPKFKSTDDGYDAWKDHQLTTYGSLPKRRYYR